MLLDFLVLMVGFAVLVGGAEFMVRGAAGLAIKLGMKPLVVGLTIIAFGTSAPELVVTGQASLSGSTGLAIGNVYGSNVANILLILGCSALIKQLLVSKDLIKRELPIMIGATILVLVMVQTEGISRPEGFLLLGCGFAYFAWTIVAGLRSPEVGESTEEMAEVSNSKVVDVLYTVAGILGIFLGGKFLVDSATSIAAELGVSDLVIGLTVVAIGTSLPELATSVVATLRGQREIVAGNVVGSNILNLLLVLGTGAALASGGLQAGDSAEVDGLIMLASAVVILPIFFDGGNLRRWEGALLLVAYFGYITYVTLEATEAELVSTYETFGVFFFSPMLAVAVLAWTYRGFRARETYA